MKSNAYSKNASIKTAQVDLDTVSLERQSRKPTKTIPVRLTHEQWFEAREFALIQDRSLQEIFVEGLNAVRTAKGFPPLSGTKA
jgi:hypothetical protein